MRKFDLQLRALRTKKGLTLTELAEKIGSNYQAVGRWERGTTEITLGDALREVPKVRHSGIYATK